MYQISSKLLKFGTVAASALGLISLGSTSAIAASFQPSFNFNTGDGLGECATSLPAFDCRTEDGFRLFALTTPIGGAARSTRLTLSAPEEFSGVQGIGVVGGALDGEIEAGEAINLQRIRSSSGGEFPIQFGLDSFTVNRLFNSRQASQDNEVAIVTAFTGPGLFENPIVGKLTTRVDSDTGNIATWEVPDLEIFKIFPERFTQDGSIGTGTYTVTNPFRGIVANFVSFTTDSQSSYGLVGASVPEPFVILGSLTALGFGSLMRRNSSKDN